MNIKLKNKRFARSARHHSRAAACLQILMAIMCGWSAKAQAQLHSLKSGLTTSTGSAPNRSGRCEALAGTGLLAALHAQWRARDAIPQPMCRADAHDWRAGDAKAIHVDLESPSGAASVELLDANGTVPVAGLRTLAQLMGCSLRQRCQTHPRLVVLLAKISKHFGGRTIQLVSGYRKPGGFTQPTSRHTMGRATDIRVRGVSRRKLWNRCRSLKQTGCGYYPNSLFVHVDVREESAQWVDWSQPGSRPSYGTLQRPYTQDEWSSPDRARVARFISRPDEVALTVRVVDATGAVLQLVDEQPEAASLSALAQALLSRSPASASELSEQAAADTGAAAAPPPHVASARRPDPTGLRVLIPKGQEQLHPL